MIPMKLLSVFDKEFAPYGKVVTGYDVAPLLKKLEETTEKPTDAVIYVPSDAGLEALPIFEQMKNNVYGGMPIQFGYCNGSNTKLNCVEYHRDSEVNIPANDMVFLVALECEIQNGKLDASCVKAFSAPAGTAVELYATTLHYAPCDGHKGEGFRVVVVLPRGTNEAKPAITPVNEEDKMLFAANKWLLAHPDSSEASQGAVVGIVGENPDIAELL